jgi:hypothetical protein
MQTIIHRPLNEAVLYHFHDLSEEEYKFRVNIWGGVNHQNQTKEYRNQRIFDIFDDAPWQVLRKSVPPFNNLIVFKIKGNRGSDNSV